MSDPRYDNYKPIPSKPHLVKTPVGDLKRVVVCAANRLDDGLIICGARHWDPVMRAVADRIGWDDCRTAEQGFIDQWQNFMTREEARYVAIENGQVKEEDLETNLIFSEDLY